MQLRALLCQMSTITIRHFEASERLPIRLPLNLCPCGDLGYLAVPESL
jgi:hypothetical protein